MKIRESTVIYILIFEPWYSINKIPFSFILRKLNIYIYVIYLYVVHFAVPDESHAKLHQEYTSETQAQVERGTTSSTARLTSK